MKGLLRLSQVCGLKGSSSRSLSTILQTSRSMGKRGEQASISPAVPTEIFKRGFAGKGKALSVTAVGALSDVLTNEIMEEAANDEVDSELEVIQKEIMKTFALEETPGNGLVKLTRKYKNEEIEITFNCQDESEGSIDEDDFLKGSENGMNEDGEFDNEDEDDFDFDQDMKYGINFTAKIRKNKKEMVFFCTADQNITVNKVRVVPEGSNDDEDTDKYEGPPFENLSDGLQEAFTTYLEDRSINPDMCHFILSYSAHKEQKEYVQWLKTLSEFTG